MSSTRTRQSGGESHRSSQSVRDQSRAKKSNGESNQKAQSASRRSRKDDAHKQKQDESESEDDNEEDEDDTDPSASAGKRSYNSQNYWDQRYQRHLAKSANTASSTNADLASSPSSSAANSKKRGRSSNGKPSMSDIEQDDLDSDDITNEWYYSFNDLAHILLPALRPVDRSLRVLDIGCGISNLFKELTQPLKEEKGEKKEIESKKKSNKKTSKSGEDDEVAEVDDVGGAGFTGDCIGLDYSPTVIEYLRKNFPTEANPKLHWICGDACHLLPNEESDDEETQSQLKKSKKPTTKKRKLSSSSSSSAGPPPLTPTEQAFFTPNSYGLILDKATSDGMLCSDETAVLTPLIYANVARLLAPNGVFLIVSVNDPDSGWFGEYVVSQLLSHSSLDCHWDIEVHSPSNYTDGDEGAPNVYIIRKRMIGGGARSSSGRQMRDSTQQQRERYSIKQISY